MVYLTCSMFLETHLMSPPQLTFSIMWFESCLLLPSCCRIINNPLVDLWEENSEYMIARNEALTRFLKVWYNWKWNLEDAESIFPIKRSSEWFYQPNKIRYPRIGWIQPLRSKRFPLCIFSINQGLGLWCKARASIYSICTCERWGIVQRG